MIFGSEAIGSTAIAEAIGPNIYQESLVGQLIINGTSINLQSPFFDSVIETSSFNITINVDSPHIFKLNSIESSLLVYNATEFSNKSYFEGIHQTDFFVSGITNNFIKLNQLDVAPLSIIGPPLGGVFPVIPEVSLGGLIFGSQTFSQHYTFLLQEFDNNEAKLAINGNSGEIYVIGGSEGGGGGISDIPQIWIG